MIMFYYNFKNEIIIKNRKRLKLLSAIMTPIYKLWSCIIMPVIK